MLAPSPPTCHPPSDDPWMLRMVPQVELAIDDLVHGYVRRPGSCAEGAPASVALIRCERLPVPGQSADSPQYYQDCPAVANAAKR